LENQKTLLSSIENKTEKVKNHMQYREERTIVQRLRRLSNCHFAAITFGVLRSKTPRLEQAHTRLRVRCSRKGLEGLRKLVSEATA
jgi:hypothetical protein